MASLAELSSGARFVAFALTGNLVSIPSGRLSPIISASHTVRILVVEAGYIRSSAFFSKITWPVSCSIRIAAEAVRCPSARFSG